MDRTKYIPSCRCLLRFSGVGYRCWCRAKPDFCVPVRNRIIGASVVLVSVWSAAAGAVENRIVAAGIGAVAS